MTSAADVTQIPIHRLITRLAATRVSFENFYSQVRIVGSGNGSLVATNDVLVLVLVMSPLGDIYSFASWQNRHFGGVFRP